MSATACSITTGMSLSLAKHSPTRHSAGFLNAELFNLDQALQAVLSRPSDQDGRPAIACRRDRDTY